MDRPLVASASDARPPVLTALRRAVRDMPLESQGVIEVVLDTMGELGFAQAALFAVDPSGMASDPFGLRGPPFDAKGAIDEVVASGEPARIGCVDAAPVWGDGWLIGVLAGCRIDVSHDESDLDVLALLASATGSGLQNAQRFELERRSIERMDRLDRLKSDFLATVSHELRTPLTAIQGMGLTLERSWDALEDDTRSSFLRSMNERAAALTALVEQLLDLSDMETARARLNAEPVDISALTDAAADRFAKEHQRHPLERSIPPGLCAMGDAALITRVIDQLLANAGKHTPVGTPVAVSASRQDDDVVVVEVADAGPGLGSDDVELAAEAFHRGGDLNTRAPGLGLGLALAEEVLMLHGSRLEVESEPGAGARFRFALPSAS